jgi:hypothetical protein
MESKEPWQIAAARFCVERDDTEFTRAELEQFLRENGYQIHTWHIHRFFQDQVKLPAGMQWNREPRGENGTEFWTAPLELVSTIVDYDELKQARESSISAWKMAAAALIVSAIAAVFQGVSLFT